MASAKYGKGTVYRHRSTLGSTTNTPMAALPAEYDNYAAGRELSAGFSRRFAPELSGP